MRSEVERILKLLEEGRITADEAYRLIEAIEKKERKRDEEESFGIFDVGRVVQDAIRTTFEVIPISIRGYFKKRPLNENLPVEEREELKIKISAGDMEIKTHEGNDIRLRGEGHYEFDGKTLKILGEVDVLVPKVKKLILEMNAGDLDGKIEADQVNLTLKAGDADMEVNSREIDALVKMGDMDITILNLPSRVNLECKMGNLNVSLPKNFEGTIESHVSMGSLKIERDYIPEGDRYIIGDRNRSLVVVKVKMGNVTIE